MGKMLRLKAVFALLVSPLLLLSSLFWLHVTGFSVWISLTVTLFLTERLRSGKYRVYSDADHWLFGVLLSFLVFLSNPVISWSVLGTQGVYILMIVCALRFSLPIRSQARRFLKKMPSLSDARSVLIRLDRIEIGFLDQEASIIETDTLKHKEIEWLSYRLILRNKGFKNHTVSVVSDERYGRLETMMLSR